MTQQSEMSNWKNVNNWHWVEKSCIDWARKWLSDSLTALPPLDLNGYSNVKVEKVSDINGDVDLNVRKGKLRYLYDLSFTISFSGKSKGDDSIVKCSIDIKEMTFDEEPSGFEYSYSGDKSFRNVVEREYLKQHLYPVFTDFPKELVSQNGSQLLVEPSPRNDNSSAGEPIIVPSQDAKNQIITSKSTEEKPKAKATTTTIEVKADFKTSPTDMFLALTDLQRISAWTHGPCKFELKQGAPFEMFQGNVSGTVDSFVRDESLSLKWRLRTWPSDVLSTVVFTIENKEDYVKLCIDQTGVPISEKDSLMVSWQKMYIERIKQTFGYIY